MLELVSEIMENLGKLSSVNELEKLPRLRRVSRIKSIHSSLAIENNALTISQVTDVINKKRVFGPQKDITEVQNANLTYNKLDEINPYELKELLAASTRCRTYWNDRTRQTNKQKPKVFQDIIGVNMEELKITETFIVEKIKEFLSIAKRDKKSDTFYRITIFLNVGANDGT